MADKPKTWLYFEVHGRKEGAGSKNATFRVKGNPRALALARAYQSRLRKAGYKTSIKGCIGTDSVAGLGLAFMDNPVDDHTDEGYYDLRWNSKTKTYAFRPSSANRIG